MLKSKLPHTFGKILFIAEPRLDVGKIPFGKSRADPIGATGRKVADHEGDNRRRKNPVAEKFQHFVRLRGVFSPHLLFVAETRAGERLFQERRIAETIANPLFDLLSCGFKICHKNNLPFLRDSSVF